MKRIFLLFILVGVFSVNLFAQFAPGDSISKFQAQIFIGSGEPFVTDAYYQFVHKLGVSSNNTLGWDSNTVLLGDYLELPVPPAPPSPFAPYSHFWNIPGHPGAPTYYYTEGGLQTGIVHDYRAFTSRTQIDSFRLVIRGDDSGLDTLFGDVLQQYGLVITWDPNQLAMYGDSWIIKPYAGSSFPETDMLSTSILTLPPTGATMYQVYIIKTGAKFTGIMTGVEERVNEIPTKFSLGQNFPNPFNPTTSIRYSIPVTGNVTLKIYDIVGREVAILVNEVKSPGAYMARFSSSTIASGVYFYRLSTSTFVSVKRMVVLK